MGGVRDQGRESEQLFPYGIYTIPEVSMIGKTEAQLTAEGVSYEVSGFPRVAARNVRLMPACAFSWPHPPPPPNDSVLRGRQLTPSRGRTCESFLSEICVVICLLLITFAPAGYQRVPPPRIAGRPRGLPGAREGPDARGGGRVPQAHFPHGDPEAAGRPLHRGRSHRDNPHRTGEINSVVFLWRGTILCRRRFACL